MWYSGLSTLILGIPPTWKKSCPKLPFLGSSLSTTYRNSVYISKLFYIYIYIYTYIHTYTHTPHSEEQYFKNSCSYYMKTLFRNFSSEDQKILWKQLRRTNVLVEKHNGMRSNSNNYHTCTRACTHTHTKLLHRLGHLLPYSALQARQQTPNSQYSDYSNPEFHSITSENQRVQHIQKADF